VQPGAVSPGTLAALGPGSSGAFVPLQLTLGARIIWPLSFGFVLNTSMDLGEDGTKAIVNANPGLYVRGHASRDKKRLGWDVWGGVGLQPLAMQVLALDSQPCDFTMITSAIEAERCAVAEMSDVSHVLTVQSLNVPLELGGTFFVTAGFGIDLVMALTFWLPSQACLHDGQDRVCTGDLDTQTSYFLGLGLSFLP